MAIVALERTQRRPASLASEIAMKMPLGRTAGGLAPAFALALWTGWAGAAALVTTIDSAGNVGSYTSMRLVGGNPVVSYYDATHGDLKVATCTAGCMGATPTWVVTTVDSGQDVGWYTSLEVNDGKPAVAYYHVSSGALKLATCIAACASPAATWVSVPVGKDSADDTGRFPSLRFDAGRPIISYRDKTKGDLMLATCTAACATDAPTWVITTVDSAGDVGRYTSMQLDAGRPVIAYFDVTRGTIKLATCSQGCATAAPSWIITTVDTVPGDIETQISLQLDDGKPVISYYDAVNGDLKLATCVAACATPAPQWVTTLVDAAGDAGEYSSMQLQGGNPVVAYMGTFFSCTQGPVTLSCHTARDLRLAVCTAGCATATPTWVVTTLDNGGIAGYDPSLQLDGDRVVATFHDFQHGDLKLAVASVSAASVPSNYTALWWNFDESGWGINFSHQGDIVFGTLFTYDAAGKPMWLSLSSGARQSTGVYSGKLSRTTGPPFNADPFTPIGASNQREVGTMTVTFAGDTAALAYTVDGVAVNKVVRKLVFGSHAADCRPTTASRASLTNYQDLWWNAAESGWGINITHQDDVIFATLFTYDASGNGLWLVLSAATRQADGSYAGELYRTTGPAFNATPFVAIGPSNYTKVGTMQLKFSDGERGTLTYSVDGVGVVKSIERLVFSSPAPACSS
jgi:hypothetical protein